MCRKAASPVRYVSIDPLNCWLKLLHMVAPDSTFVEQLYSDPEITGTDVFVFYDCFLFDCISFAGQVTALRQMSIAKPGSMGLKSSTVRIKGVTYLISSMIYFIFVFNLAMSDCLQMIKSIPIETTHCRFVRFLGRYCLPYNPLQ